MEGQAPTWLSYVRVDDAAEQVYLMVEGADEFSRRRRRAAEMQFGPQDLPSGRMAVLSDPQGAAFAIIESDYTEAR